MRLLRDVAGLTRKAVLTEGIPHTTVNVPVSLSLMPAELLLRSTVKFAAAGAAATWQPELRHMKPRCIIVLF